jgi:hypothetical protein
MSNAIETILADVVVIGTGLTGLSLTKKTPTGQMLSTT